VGEARSTNGEEINAWYRILVEKPEGNIPLGRPRCRLNKNVKIHLTDTMESSCDDSIVLSESVQCYEVPDRLVASQEGLNEIY
jgi:hypothetical protein